MSYDFLVFKPRVPVRSMADLSEQAVAMQDAREVVAGLSRLYPALAWKESKLRDHQPRWQAQMEDDETWYEFSVESPSTLAWSIRTSHRASRRAAIAAICRSLGCLAFDGQAMRFTAPDGSSFPAS